MKPIHSEADLTSVFVVVGAIEELGAKVGDRLVLRPANPERPYSLVRPLSAAEARWALRPDRCYLDFTDPPMSHHDTLRRLRDALPAESSARHLRLL